MQDQKKQEQQQPENMSPSARQRALAMAIHRSFTEIAAGEIAFLQKKREEAETAEDIATYSRAIADVRLRANEAALLTTTRVNSMRPVQAPPQAPPQEADQAPNVEKIGEMLKARFGGKLSAVEQAGTDRDTMSGTKGGDRG